MAWRLLLSHEGNDLACTQPCVVQMATKSSDRLRGPSTTSQVQCLLENLHRWRFAFSLDQPLPLATGFMCLVLDPVH